METQLQAAQERAQKAEKALTQAEVQAKGLAARVAALEAEEGNRQRLGRAEEQPGLPFDESK